MQVRTGQLRFRETSVARRSPEWSTCVSPPPRDDLGEQLKELHLASTPNLATFAGFAAR
ncbi:MAG: hypothetical protein U9R15_03585 [Chloroflexota bacterium]|nr:hypothetical protein [Chloroflexota bacterium]